MSWNKLFNLKFLVIFSVPIAFLIVGIVTLPHYGISWDESFHFQRGQAYLHYFLTGEKDFTKVPGYPKLRGDSDFMGRLGEQDIYVKAEKGKEAPDSQIRRSYYQSDVFTFSFLVSGFDGGHPPVSDILASFFNYIFYQRFGLLGDIEAYHLFEIVVSSLIILGVGIFVFYNFGFFPAVIASFSLSFYPLFFAESHFNIKDPPQAAFFGLSIVTFFFGIIYKDWKFIVLSALFTGLAAGTKFNALSIPLIVLSWLFYRFLYNPPRLNKQIILGLLTFPIIVLVIFFSSWPFLWQSPVENILKVINYYRGIGIGVQPDMGDYIFAGFNTYPIIWIIYTTPLPILILGIIGILHLIYLMTARKDDVALLILLWFSIPIIRVSLPNANIYGGVRQIMEFIPALATVCGVGVYSLLNHSLFSRWKMFISLPILLSFVFVGKELAEIHPNENVYFNQLAGGLQGAVQKQIPSWGNTYGNIYFQGIQWINENAEEGAKLGLPINNMVNVPRSKLRPDIYFSNGYPSGPERQGEYVMEMSHDWEPKKWYGFQYYDKSLTPIHEVKVDNVPILKIWKNDAKDLRPGFSDETEYEAVKTSANGNTLMIDLGKEISLTKLYIKHSSQECKRQEGGYIRLSLDGNIWVQEPETIDYPQIPLRWLGWDDKTFVFLFPVKKARFIFLDTEMENSCILKSPQIKIFALRVN